MGFDTLESMTDRKPEFVRDVRSSFAAEPGSTRQDRLAWLKAELQKGLDSGVYPRPASQIIDEAIAKRATIG
jgi:hypothetical protein